MDFHDMASVRVLSEYVFAEDPDAVIRANPELLADNEQLLADLRNARELLKGTASAVEDSQRTFQAIMDNLALPAVMGSSTGHHTSTQCSVLPAALENPSANMRAAFEALLTPLWSNALCADRAVEAIAEGAPLGADSEVATTVKWYQDDAVMAEVLSFLSAEELLSVSENVCASWRTLLYSGPRAQPFWIGVVQREYPDALRTLLEGKGGANLWDADWRTLAMTLVCADDDDGDDAADGGCDDAEPTLQCSST